MLTGFPRTRWPRRRFSESYAVRISVKISRICVFRVIMGIMTGLLGCCSSSTRLGSRANDYVHHSPCSLGCWTNNTLAAWSLSPKTPPDAINIDKIGNIRFLWYPGKNWLHDNFRFWCPGTDLRFCMPVTFQLYAITLDLQSVITKRLASTSHVMGAYSSGWNKDYPAIYRALWRSCVMWTVMECHNTECIRHPNKRI